MRAALFIVSLLIFVAAKVSCAQTTIYLNVGIAEAKMADAKELQTFYAATGPAGPMKTSSNYPAFMTYELGANFRFGVRKQFFWGVAGGYGSTGANSNYSGPLGYVNFEQRAHYISVAPSIGIAKSFFSEKLLAAFALKPGVMFNTLEYITNDHSLGSKIDETDRYNSRNFYVQPTLFISRQVRNVGFDLYMATMRMFRLEKFTLIAKVEDSLTGRASGLESG